MIRLLQISDLHPNSKATFAGKVWNDPATGKNQSLTDFRKSLAFVHQVATSPKTKVDAVVIPGDVFDSVSPTMDEIQVVLEWIEAMSDVVPILVIPGNHDMGASGNMATALEPLKFRPNVFVMERPESRLLNFGEMAVRFFALPYPSKGRLLSNIEHQGKSTEELIALANQGLAAILRSFKLEFEPGVANVLLAHGSVMNAKVGEQPRSIANDIFLPLDELEAFTFVAIGHIHASQAVAKNVVYAGSIMRNSFGEESEYKGFNLIEINDPEEHAKVTFVENPHARKYATLDLSDLEFYHHNGETLDPEIVWRLKASMTPQDYQEKKAFIEQMAGTVPFFQIAVDLLEEDRARDASMSQMMSMEEALVRVLEHASDTERPVLVERHRGLVAEVEHAR